MPEPHPSQAPLMTAEQVAESLAIDVEEVVALILDGRLAGAQVGNPPRWRVTADSVEAYLDDAAEEARRMALWRESNAASFPELWGRGHIRHGD